MPCMLQEKFQNNMKSVKAMANDNFYLIGMSLNVHSLCEWVHVHVQLLGLCDKQHLFPDISQPLYKVRYKPHFTNEKSEAKRGQSWQQQCMVSTMGCGLWCSWGSNPGWPDWIRSLHQKELHVRIGFFPVETASITGKGRSTKLLHRTRDGEELGATKWQCFFILRQNSFDFEFSLHGPNWTEGNCPICWQNQPPRLQRFPARGRKPPGVRREMETEALTLTSAAAASGGLQPHAAAAGHPGWLLFESEGLHRPTPSLPLNPNIPRAQFLFEVDVLLFTRPTGEAQRD